LVTGRGVYLRNGGAYQLKVELSGDILTVFSGLVELTEKLERLDIDGKEERELCYVM
jgi:hypothetical protein